MLAGVEAIYFAKFVRKRVYADTATIVDAALADDVTCFFQAIDQRGDNRSAKPDLFTKNGIILP